MAAGECSKLVLDEGAHEYVTRRIEEAARQGAPLAALLSDFEPTAVFALLEKRSHDRARLDLCGWQIGTQSDRAYFERFLLQWLHSGDASDQRCVVFEEFYARRPDSAPPLGPDFYFGDRVYSIGQGLLSVSAVGEVVAAFSGPPGIGLLSSPGESLEKEMTAADLSALARGVDAVLIPAWDDEAFVVAVGATVEMADFDSALRAAGVTIAA